MRMCPHCGQLYPDGPGLIPYHYYAEVEDEPHLLPITCPGSMQGARNPETDGRILWNESPNPHLKKPEVRICHDT